MRIGDTTEIAVRSIPHSSSPPHPTPKGDITSGEWLLGNICSECMGLSYASGAVCSCAGQQSANPPPEELDCWAVVAHPAVLSQPMAYFTGGSRLLRNRQRSDLEVHRSLPFRGAWPYDWWLHCLRPILKGGILGRSIMYEGR